VYLLSGVSITVSLVLLIWLARLPRSAFWTALPVSLILGGAIGNLIDRVRFGYVIDFLDFHARGWHYATFNVADSAVSIGAAWLIVRLLYESFARQP
jgi:signal peptidase II